MSEVKFKKEMLDLTNTLTAMNEKILFEKEGDKVLISRWNDAGSLAYQLRFPKSCFDFSSDKIGFFNYPEFHQFFSIYKNPSIEQTDKNFVISENKSKTKYMLSNIENIKEGPKKINFAEPMVSFKLPVEKFRSIKKFIALIPADRVSLIVKDNKITIKLFTLSTDNAHEEEFDLVSNTVKEDFEIVFTPDVFTVIPEYEYTIDVKKEGIIRISYVKDDIDLKIYTAETVDN